MKPKSESWRQAALARADFEMVALDYFRRLGHDNHHRLFQVYGWEEKKTKTQIARKRILFSVYLASSLPGSIQT